MGLWTNIQAAPSAEEGSTFVEYALVISFIVLSSLAALRMIGVEVHLDVQQLINLFR